MCPGQGGTPVCLSGGIFSPTDSSWAGIPAPSARALVCAVVSPGIWSSCRRRFVSALCRPLRDMSVRCRFRAAGAPPAGGCLFLLSASMGPGSSGSIGFSVSAVADCCGSSGGLFMIAQAQWARHRESSVSVNSWLRRDSMPRSAIRWISARTHTPQLTPSGCRGVV